MKKLVLLVACCMMLFSAALCHAEGAVKLGVIAAKTGEASTSNMALFRTAKFAADEINNAGGLLGKQIEVLEFDNQSTPLGSQAAAQKAVEAGVVAVIGASWSSHSAAMAPVLQKAGIPMISPISTNPKVTLEGDYIFRACFIDPFQGKVMARYAKENLGAQTAVILVNVSRTYSTGLAEVFSAAFKALGGKILWEGEYLQDVADYSALIRKTKELNPDVIYLPGDYRDSSFIIGQARNMGLKTLFLGADAFGMRLYDYIGKQAEGSFYTTHWNRVSPLPQSREFVKNYEEEFGEIKQTTIPLTYDSVKLWADAVLRAGTFDTAKVRDAIAATKDFVGATGKISFDENGDPVKPAVINKLENLGITFIGSAMP